jgi:hypothetical protein
MIGAREYADLFTTGQYNRLYISSHYHARGKTFRIYVLPEGEAAIPNGPNGPLNKDAVEVYGITGGHHGWTETYGWLHQGKWVDDFNLLVTQKTFEKNEKLSLRTLEIREAEQEKEAQKKALLDSY